MTDLRADRRKPRFRKTLLAALLLLLAAGLVFAVVEFARPGLLRGKIYTAYFVAKAATWEWEYPNEMPDTRLLDRVAKALLAPDIARMPVKTWQMGAPQPFEVFLPSDPGGVRPVDRGLAPLSPPSASWKHQDGGALPGSDWHAPDYDDSDWQTVQTPFVLVGGSASTQPGEGPATTASFRRAFDVPDPSMYRVIDIELQGGDGAVVYLNGTEIFRRNLPVEEPSTQAQAAAAPIGRPENPYYLQSADARLLRPGRNVLAVELHQASLNGSFDLILHGGLQADSVRFAVIGDFGTGGRHARAVAELVKRWEPYFIITTGDNNYSSGEARTIDKNVGQFYQEYIAPYYGRYGPGADRNRFFPSMGNHDWSDNNDIPSPPNAYLNYFSLPPGQGRERYYDFQWGPVHFFALDSDRNEPDGITADSIQGRWFQETLQASQAPWKLVYMHHPPFSSSDTHPPTPELDWPFAEWGASLVVSGHNHFYERLERNNIPYIINGAGGGELYGFGAPTAGSLARFTGDYGAMLVQGGPCQLTMWFITTGDAVIDRLHMTNPAPVCRLTATP